MSRKKGRREKFTDVDLDRTSKNMGSFTLHMTDRALGMYRGFRVAMVGDIPEYDEQNVKNRAMVRQIHHTVKKKGVYHVFEQEPPF
jgi:hypothetical protein